MGALKGPCHVVGETGQRVLGILGMAAFTIAAGSQVEAIGADAIFDHARAVWASAVYPREIAFDITETVTHGSIASSSHYHSSADVHDGSVFGGSVSDEEISHPYTPHGIAFRFVVTGPGLPPYGLTLGAPEHTYDFIGVPRLSPAYSFGLCSEFVTSKPSADLVAEVRAGAGEVRKIAPDEDQLHVIATVSAKSRDYAATLVGMEQIDGHMDYHLKLVPLKNPSVFRLRDLWVRSDTYETDRAATRGNFSQPPFTESDWVATFREIDGAEYLVSEETTRPFSVNGRHYDSARIVFGLVRSAPISNLQRLSFFGYNPINEPAPLIEPGR